MNSIPLNIDWQQILLHLFNFGILAGGLYFLLYKPVKDFMEKREAHYREMDDKANSDLAKAEELKSAYSKQMDEIDEELRVRKNESDQKAIEDGEAIIADAKEQAEKIITEAKALAQTQKDRIIDSAREDIAKLAAEAAEKVVNEALGASAGPKGASDEG